METAALQKGLILMCDNQELIDEGMGFGVPVAKFADKTYFSGSAEVTVQRSHLNCNFKKTYLLDTISRKKFGRSSYIDDGLYSSVRKSFAKLYLTRKELSPLFNTIMELREVAKIKTEFMKVKPRGAITVNYEIQPSAISVSVDFSDFRLNGCEELLVLNEQGSTTFEKYLDSGGLKLLGREIGGWDAVKAKEAAMVNVGDQFAFSLQTVSGATLFRGWERTKNRFSWAGLSYSLRPSHGVFNYLIRVDYKSTMVVSNRQKFDF